MCDTFLVCGLGSLGQNCVVALKKFGVKVIAIEQHLPLSWEIKILPDLLEQLIIGDCSDKLILTKARIERCRAALIVTTAEKINVKTAISIRQLNPKTRLVLRSAQENLNELLSQELGNFIAYEPTHLPANAFALSALGTETLGLFSLDNQQLRISQIKLSASHPWCNFRLLSELNTRTRRIIDHSRLGQSFLTSFYQWQPETKLLANDRIIYIETEDNFRLNPHFNAHQKSHFSPPRLGQTLANFPLNLAHLLTKFWQLSLQQQIRRVALFSGLIIILLVIVGTFLFKNYYQGTTFFSAFYVTATLLLGGYGDLFGSFEPIRELPQWLQLFSLGLTLTGTAFVGVIYALLTEALLSSKFEFTHKQPAIPTENHLVVVGCGRVGERVAKLLREYKQTVLGISFNSQIEQSKWQGLPLIIGNVQESLKKAHLDRAKSVVVVTDDDIVNLEVALITQLTNPRTNLVIRSNDEDLTENLTQLLPQASVIGVYQVSAEAFAGAAFGENILHILHFAHQTILVTEYQISQEDTLNGLLLSEIAYGYGVMPILYQAYDSYSPTLLPGDDLQVNIGDRLIILGTIEGLRRIEAGNRERQTWELVIQSAYSNDALFEGANAITRISGCPLAVARETMNNLPQTLPVKLYHHQAVRLVKALGKNRIKAELKH